MVNTRGGRLRAALSATWTTVLITILFSGCNLDNEWRGPALVCAQSTDLQADRWEQADGQGAALDGLRSRRLSAVRVEKDGDRVGGGEYDYEYMDVTDTARDADVSAEGEVVEEKVAAFGRLSSDDIAKDVFSARMQDVLSRRAHVIETPNRIKVKAGKRYLAPRAGDADGLSLSSGVDGPRQSKSPPVEFHRREPPHDRHGAVCGVWCRAVFLCQTAVAYHEWVGDGGGLRRDVCGVV